MNWDQIDTDIADTAKELAAKLTERLDVSAEHLPFIHEEVAMALQLERYKWRKRALNDIRTQTSNELVSIDAFVDLRGLEKLEQKIPALRELLD